MKTSLLLSATGLVIGFLISTFLDMFAPASMKHTHLKNYLVYAGLVLLSVMAVTMIALIICLTYIQLRS